MTNEERLDILEVLADAIRTARMEVGCRLTRGTAIAVPLDVYRRLTDAVGILDQLDTEVGHLVSDAMEATAATEKLARMKSEPPPKKPAMSVFQDEEKDRQRNRS